MSDPVDFLTRPITGEEECRFCPRQAVAIVGENTLCEWCGAEELAKAIADARREWLCLYDPDLFGAGEPVEALA